MNSFSNLVIKILKSKVFRENPCVGFSIKYIDELLRNPSLISKRGFPVFWPSGVYGLGKCLRAVVGFPWFIPIPVYHDHGTSLSSSLEDHEILNFAHYHLTWPLRRYQALYNKISDKRILRIAHPYIYYKNLKKIAMLPGSRGTLLFPPHSTGDIEVCHDTIEWIESIKRLAVFPEPLVVCLHPTDIRTGADVALHAKGYQVVTAGNSQSDLFVDRFFELLSCFSHSVSSCIGSELFLSHQHGLNHTIYGKQPEIFLKNQSAYPKGIWNSFNDIDIEEINRIENLFLFPKESSLDSVRTDLVSEYLGFDALNNSSLLRHIFMVELLRLSPRIVNSFLKRFCSLLFK